MTSVIGRRAPEFEKLRSLKDDLNQIKTERNYYKNLLAIIDRTDPRFQATVNKVHNMRIKKSIINSAIRHERESLKDKGIVKGAMRHQVKYNGLLNQLKAAKFDKAYYEDYVKPPVRGDIDRMQNRFEGADHEVKRIENELRELKLQFPDLR